MSGNERRIVGPTTPIAFQADRGAENAAILVTLAFDVAEIITDQSIRAGRRVVYAFYACGGARRFLHERIVRVTSAGREISGQSDVAGHNRGSGANARRPAANPSLV